MKFTRKELETINKYLPVEESALKAKLNRLLEKPLSFEEMYETAKTMTKAAFMDEYLTNNIERKMFDFIHVARQVKFCDVYDYCYYTEGFTNQEIMSAYKRMIKLNIIWEIDDMADWVGGDFQFKS